MRRAVILVIALAGTLVCTALLVREGTLAVDTDVVWSPPHWWHELLTGPPAVAALVGVALALAGVVCLWLGLAMLGSGGSDGGGGVELGDDRASTVVTAGALEHLLAGVIAGELDEVERVDVRVTRRDERLVTRTFLAVAATDLARLRERVRTIVGRELRAATGTDPGEVMVEVDDLVAGRGGET